MSPPPDCEQLLSAFSLAKCCSNDLEGVVSYDHIVISFACLHVLVSSGRKGLCIIIGGRGGGEGGVQVRTVGGICTAHGNETPANAATASSYQHCCFVCWGRDHRVDRHRFPSSRIAAFSPVLDWYACFALLSPFFFETHRESEAMSSPTFCAGGRSFVEAATVEEGRECEHSQFVLQYSELCRSSVRIDACWGARVERWC